MIKKIARYLIISCFFLGVTVQLNARHIVGGDVAYTCVGFETILGVDYINLIIEFNMYRDTYSGGADFDGTPNSLVPGRFGIYRGNGTFWNFFDEVDNVSPVLIEDVLIGGSPCVAYPDNVGVEHGLYRFSVRLPVSATQSYMIAYQRCCRNESIANILNPGETGAAYTIQISPLAQQICNNSPRFNNFPPVIICANFDIDFDHSATDPEGHQIVYDFCAPLTSGGTDGASTPGDPLSCSGVTPAPSMCLPPFDEVNFTLPNYSFGNPMGGNPQITINQNTGLITGVPTIVGQFVVGVCVREFLNGQVLSIVRRDFQFNVVPCDPLVLAGIESDSIVYDEVGNKEYIISACGEYDIDFVNESVDIDFIEEYVWNIDVGGQIETFSTRDVSYTFPDTGSYAVQMLLNPGTICADTANINVNIFPIVEADLSFAYDTCVADSVSFESLSITGANSITENIWDFGGEGNSALADPKFLFPTPGVKPIQLISIDNNGCRDSITKDLSYYPAPSIIIIDPSSFIGCAPQEIFFDNLSSPINAEYDIVWDFGDGSFSDEISPTHVFEDPGTYSISIDITSPIGCMVADTFDNIIRIKASPIANFSMDPEMPSVFRNEVEFTDLSIDAVSWQWLFGDGGLALISDPIHTFVDTGVFDIQLVVTHESGCTDTLIKRIDMVPFATFHMPNAFTPNGDSGNDVFIGDGYLPGIEDFIFTVWNRWGEKIFETTNPREGWNGTKFNTGQASPVGVYVYEVSFNPPRGARKRLRGHATLIR